MAIFYRTDTVSRVHVEKDLIARTAYLKVARSVFLGQNRQSKSLGFSPSAVRARLA